MRELFAVLEKIAPSECSVLVQGESGTGKELVAQAIHERSRRAGGPLVVLDCASVPSSLLESELFGHERGAFTGAAAARPGRFEDAHRGTLFLDEIGELPLELQPKLLGVLDRSELRRIGATRPTGVDVRIVAATHRNLAEEVNAGTFREDLYYRLAVVELRVPPLRERTEDIPLLVRKFLEGELGRPGDADTVLAHMSEDTWRSLEAQPWRGNVRELRNLVQRTLALSGQGPLVVDGAPAARPLSLTIDLERSFHEVKETVVDRLERLYVESQLARHDGNITHAAAAAGLDRQYFRRLLRKHRARR
jgi:DNA-binding NtrC family response regulator